MYKLNNLTLSNVLSFSSKKNNDTKVEVPALLSGGRPMIPLYTIISECEKAVLLQTSTQPINLNELAAKFTLQSNEEDQEIAKIAKIWSKYVNSKSGAINKWLADDRLTYCVDTMIHMMNWYKKCETWTDYYNLTFLSYRLIMDKPMSMVIMKHFFPESNLQASFRDNVKYLREMFENFTNVTNSSFVEKMSKMYAYLVAQGFMKAVGLEITEKEFSLLEKTYVKKEYESRYALFMHSIDLALFLCERLVVYRETGEIQCFFHNTSTYADWLTKADKTLSLAPFTSNLAAHGTTYFSFLSDLNDLIEKGIAISKFSNKNNGTENILIKRKLMSLQLIKNTEVTRKAAQKERKAPFGVLVHGGSSVAKSAFTKMLYYYYGSLHGLEKDDHYRYVRSPADEYWSNFDSSKWCIQMDDIAFLLPGAAGEVDPTLMELLNVVNNVPYVPPQAALEDKGKTPVMAKLVVATSNAADLNAHEYFHCPLAVRRRLPFVVKVEPKQQYLHENGRFIEPTSLPTDHTGFPDFWRITLQKLVPVMQGKREWATLETVKVYDNVNEFLVAFGKATHEHEANQAKSMVCDEFMKELSVCPLCMNVTTYCDCQLQSQDNWDLFIEWIISCIVDFAVWLYSFSFIKYLTQQSVKSKVVRYTTIKLLAPWLNKEQQVALMGFLNTIHFSKKFKQSMVVISLIGLALTGFLSASWIRKPKKIDTKVTPNKEEIPEEEYIEVIVDGQVKKVVKRYLESIVEDTESELVPQGNMYGTVESQLLKEETQNVWYNPNIELTTFDMPISSTSLVGKSPHELRDIFHKNCVRLMFECIDSMYNCRTGGVMLTGQICLFNNHVLKEHKNFRVTVIRSNPLGGLNSNITFTINVDDMRHDKSRDLSMMLIKSLPPFKDITRFWVDTQISVSRLCMLKRNNDATMRVLDVHGTVTQKDFPIESLNIKVDMIMGMCGEPTQSGDCGSLAIANTPRGPVLCGLHTIGYNNTLGVPYVEKSVLDVMISSLIPQNFIVQGCGAPKLGLNDEMTLVPPHFKSLVRYLETGNVNVYGTFSGFRCRPRSKVIQTPLCAQMCEHFNTTIKHGKPAMNGWEPWRKNLVEMIKPVVKHDRALLDRCARAFAQDVINKLPKDWQKELLFLSDKASVNGLPSVKYIDRLNTGSSMGFPWNTTKKTFLVPDVDELYPEGVNFVPEVWERVELIKEKYARGERAFPVFTGHLKDEATTLKKCEIKKTRLFTGGPVDWSIVVRSRFLTFVRLVQQNKFVFEAAPGLVTQSEEWGEVRKFLTHFGEERIIAGDYGQFDKHMISDFVLAAFEMIVMIYEAAGFDQNELRELYCIGNDIAFPLVNVNGDLLEFFGTNPSGHPLTVIVNSLVNSLYMRYAFGVLGGDVEKFQESVHLFTYGDDNAMGVSPTVPFFNHTAIQTALYDIGVTYTMADKDAESRPYITIDECSFLKRTWRYDEDVGAYLAPLDIESIHRSLTMWKPSDTINEYKQMVDVIVAANNEFFFYGKEVFALHHAFFREMISIAPFDAYVVDSTLPSWQDLYERFWRASGKPVPACI